MYGHGSGGSGYSGGGGGSSSRKDKGINLALEPHDGWKIMEISYDGMEKFIQPESFADHVGKLARKIDWRTLVDADEVYDNPSLLPEEEQSDEEEENVDDEVPEREKKEFPPEVGPWQNVAKNLHEALLNINVMLDNLQVMQHLEYIKPLTVSDPMQYMEQNVPHATELAANGKAFQWVWKRKALNEVQAIVENNYNQRRVGTALGETVDQAFFHEIEQLCMNWRIRKTGDHLYGDLGYKRYGPKFEPGDLFDAKKRPMPVVYSSTCQSLLEVSVPKDLERRSKIFVSIFKDDSMSDTTSLSKVTIDQGFTKVDKKAIEDLYWRDALTWAQESLICRDTFNQLATDAVHLKQRMSTFRDGVLIISLHDDYLLKVEIKHYPFKAGDLPEEGDAYLNRALRQMVVTQHSQRLIRSQMFVELPLTTMNEQLDMRGPNALTQQEIDERGKKPASLLEKLLLVSSHHRLVQLTVETLKMFQAECSDPQIKWRWLRCTPTNSQALVHITDPQFDFLMGKVTFYVKVTTDCISVVNKEGHAIDCYRDQDRLLNSLKYMNSNFFLNATANLGKIAWTYQILHGNNNAMDVHGNPAPTLYFSNPSSTRAILIQFHINQDPEISVKKQTVDESAPFIKLVYKKLPGKSLCKKMDNLFAILRE